MNNMQKVLIQASFQKVLPIADVAAELFYGRLFELDPALRPMFRGDMKQQGKKLMSSLRVVVMGLDRLDQLVPAIESLARRHVGYGVKDEHYEIVGAALIWTLQQGLGDGFTPSVAAAWVEAYNLVAGVMKAAAAQAVQPEPRSIRVPAAVHVSVPAQIAPPPASRIITAEMMPLSQRAPLSQRMPLSQRAPLSQHTPLSQRIPPTRRVPQAPMSTSF